MSNNTQSTSSLIDSSSAAMSNLYSGVTKEGDSSSGNAGNDGDNSPIIDHTDVVKPQYKDSETIGITLEDLRLEDEEEVEIPVDIPYMKASGQTKQDEDLKSVDMTTSNDITEQTKEQQQQQEITQQQQSQEITQQQQSQEMTQQQQSQEMTQQQQSQEITQQQEKLQGSSQDTEPLHAGTVTKLEEEEEEEEEAEEEEEDAEIEHTSSVISPVETSTASVSTLSPNPTGTSQESQVSQELDTTFGTEVIKGDNVFDNSEGDAQTAYDAAKDYKSIMDQSSIVIFSKTYCPFSQALKDLLLSEKSIYKFDPEPVVIEFDTMENKNGPILQEYVKEQTGRKTVPNLIVNGISRGGSDDIHALHEKDTLYESFEEWCGTLCKISKVLAPPS